MTVGSVVVALLLGVVFVRLVWLQGFGGHAYALAAAADRTRTESLHAARGEILDRNGVPLAYTADAKDVVADPTLVPAAERYSYAVALAPLVSLPVEQVQTLLTGNGKSQYALLATALSPAQADAVEALRVNGSSLTGVYTQATQQRLYPGQTIGSNVVGLVQSDGVGAAGIEQTYNSLLKGKDGSLSYEIDSSGNVNPSGQITRHNAVNGGSVTLTLDQDLQYVAQTQLDAMVKQSGARGGQVTVESVKGEVLAMASTGSFNSQDPSTIDPNKQLNPNIQAMFEPGSTNKIVTMAAALDAGLITPTTVVSVPDTITEGGITVHDAWWHPVQKFTTTGILAESSNVGTLEIAKKVGEQRFYDYLQKFGLGQQTGIELPGETAGLLPSLAQWSGASFANLPIGQGVDVTSLQLASMYQTVANGGVRIPPRIVQSVTNPDLTVQTTKQPAGIQVMTPTTAQTLRTMLESVTMTGGTGVKAAITGYRVAGKTGTAQQIDPKTGAYSNSVYWDTFAGMVPADNPQFVVSIMIDNPAKGLEGGDVAAPLFHHIAAYELSAAKIPPTGSKGTLVPLTEN